MHNHYWWTRAGTGRWAGKAGVFGVGGGGFMALSRGGFIIMVSICKSHSAWTFLQLNRDIQNPTLPLLGSWIACMTQWLFWGTEWFWHEYLTQICTVWHVSLKGKLQTANWDNISQYWKKVSISNQLWGVGGESFQTSSNVKTGGALCKQPWWFIKFHIFKSITVFK